jgi:hypothetical protein
MTIDGATSAEALWKRIRIKERKPTQSVKGVTERGEEGKWEGWPLSLRQSPTYIRLEEVTTIVMVNG